MKSVIFHVPTPLVLHFVSVSKEELMSKLSVIAKILGVSEEQARDFCLSVQKHFPSNPPKFSTIQEVLQRNQAVKDPQNWQRSFLGKEARAFSRSLAKENLPNFAVLRQKIIILLKMAVMVILNFLLRKSLLQISEVAPGLMIFILLLPLQDMIRANIPKCYQNVNMVS